MLRVYFILLGLIQIQDLFKFGIITIISTCTQLGDGWFRRFKKENKILFLRKGQEKQHTLEEVTYDIWESENITHN